VVVLFAIPQSAEKDYLSVIITFSELLKDKMFLPVFRQSKHPEEMFEMLMRVTLHTKSRRFLDAPS